MAANIPVSVSEPPGSGSGGRGLRASIRDFFFAEEVPYGLALVRIMLPLVLLYVMLRRWAYAREFYSSDGATAPLADDYGFRNMLPVPSGTVAVIMVTLLVILLVTLAIGWRTRISAIGCFVIYTHLNMLDCLSSFTKYSVIASHVLLLLSLSHCGAVWSVDAWLSREPGQPPPRFAAWQRRLMQLLIGAIYFGAAFTKIHTPTFFSGDQLRFWLMTHINHEHPWGEYLTLYPVVVMLFAYLCVVWEILFVFLAWRGHGRWIMLTMGAMFHLGTRVFIGLYVFPFVTTSIYWAFVNEGDVANWKARLARFRSSDGSKHRAGQGISRLWQRRVSRAFPAMLLIAIVLGVELEYRLDSYGIRRPEGPHELVELDPAQVEPMLQPAGTVRPVDLVHSLETGTMLVGGHVVRHKSSFKQGDKLFAQCTVIPPHPDMVIECNLHDADDRVLDRVNQVVRREAFRANFLYVLHDALAPGEYALVVRCFGKEVMRRRITLTAHSDAEQSADELESAPVAN
ncbi:MAG: HTTM domain-containing protein [Planctomycetaceae bacterium]|nr:HTTM domain-containing protein [Planctomycetaceae bacterium]